jgi:replicative DNA helicase
MSKIVDHDLERFLIAGLFQHKDKYDEITPFIEVEDFDLSIHKTVYSFITSAAAIGEEYDYKLIAFKIEQSKLRYEMELTIGEYLETISLIKISEDSLVEYAKRLKALSVRRQIETTALEVAKKMQQCGDQKYSEIVGLADATFYQGVKLFETEERKPIDVFEDIENKIEEMGNNQLPDGVICPFTTLRNYYGNFLPGHIYVIAARLKAGKSSCLQNISYLSTCFNKEQTVRVLYLDTELSTDHFQTRLIASISGVREAYIRSGLWRKNAELCTKVRAATRMASEFLGKLKHVYIGGATIESVIPLIRRWHRQEIANHYDGNGVPIYGMVCLDYLKLSEELDMASRLRTDQILGRKVDLYKQICTDINVSPLTAIQTSRANAGVNRVSDSSVISNSDMVAQLASNVCLLERLELDDVQKLQVDFGVNATHSLVSVASRNQGIEAPGFTDHVKIQVGDKVEYVDNKIYYNFDNFKITEIASLDSLVNNGYNIQGNHSDDINL